MKQKNIYKNYCVGCGLCKSEFNCNKYSEDGFTYFDISKVDSNFLNNVCPVSGKALNYYKNNIWGELKEVYYGWSNDKQIRHKASSGGIITTLAIYLLEKKYVDAVIQIKPSESNPIGTEVIISKNKKDVLECMGSRYSNSSVLEFLNTMIDKEKKYALIGRPCDILILKNYQEEYHKYTNIVYTLSFFCAGNPSDNANHKLIKDLGINDVKKCNKMNYRGNGWPGYATATDKSGKEYQMRYAESWGNYLGRNIRLMCKFCVDGCGAAADISCGDGWYLNENNFPLFDENEGRNLIFARTEKGNELIKNAVKEKYIEIQNFDDTKESIKDIQPAQYQRTTTIYDKYIAFKLFGKNTPNYNIKTIKKLAKNNKILNRLKIFIGTIKRIIKGKM